MKKIILILSLFSLTLLTSTNLFSCTNPSKCGWFYGGACCDGYACGDPGAGVWLPMGPGVCAYVD